jgi:hypothetical protein
MTSVADRSSEALESGLRGVRAALERLVAELRLSEREVPAPLQTLSGQLRDGAAELRTRRFGDDEWTLTLAEIAVVADGSLRAVTAIGSRHGSLAPILGVDLVAIGGALSLIAVDLGPTDEAVWADEAEPVLAALHRATEGRVVARRWPAFALEVFSPRALLCGAHRGDEATVLAAVAAFVTDAAPVLAASRPATAARISAADQRRRRWHLAERGNRREHNALARMFGEGPAAAYIDYLFPAD